jgi:hypothetical protein
MNNVKCGLMWNILEKIGKLREKKDDVSKYP